MKSQQPPYPLPAALLVAGLLLALLAGSASPLYAEIYYWKDSKGVVHMTDRKTGDAAQVGTVIDTSKAGPAGAGTDRRTRLEAMLAGIRKKPQLAMLQQIVADYRRSHSYSTADYFVCVDMALELSNILKTKGFSPTVVAGSIKVDTAGVEPSKLRSVFDHAWVVVSIETGVYLALEATGGFAVDEKIPNFAYYYQGLAFENPRQAKETDVLIRNTNDTCKVAAVLVNDWNARFAGKQMSSGGSEVKGRMDAKVAECNESAAKYEELIARQYRTFY